MTNDVLSQEEVETLLQELEDETKRSGGAYAGPRGSATPTKPRERVNPYDFKRPERVGQEQMRALQSLHDGFARSFGASLSGLLRSMVEVKLTSVDQLTYSEFLFGLENPTCFNLLNAVPLEGHLILDINPSVLYPIIDRLLGGGQEETQQTRRPMTEIELRLVSRITDRFLDELTKAWENILHLDLSVERVESNPQLIQVVPPSEVVVMLLFELSIGGTRGMMNLCIPYNSIERISSKLTANSWIGYGKFESGTESQKLMAAGIRDANVEVVVTLAETTLKTGDLIGLRVGDIITTDKDVRSPMELSVEGIRKFQTTAGAYKGRTAVQIVDRYVPPQAPQLGGNPVDPTNNLN
jgi:flagellar motor switch protein FliM